MSAQRAEVVRALREFLDDLDYIGEIELPGPGDYKAERPDLAKQLGDVRQRTDDLVDSLRRTFGITNGELG